MSPHRSKYGFALWGVACLVISVVGFWPSYVQPMTTGAYVSPSPMMQLHVICTSLWLVLLITQPVLIQVTRPTLHKRLGVLGILVAGGIVLTGVEVQRDVMPAYAAVDDEINAVLIPFIRFTLLLAFAACIGMAVVYRRHTDWHKRLMLYGTFPLLQSPIDRLFGNVLGLPQWRGLMALAGHILLMLLFLVWDHRSHGKVHPVSKWSTIGLTVFFVLSPALASTPLWKSVAAHLAAN